MCIFPTPGEADRSSPRASADRQFTDGRGLHASDLLLAAKPAPRQRPGFGRHPKQTEGDSRPPRANFYGGAPLNDAPLSEWNLHPIVDFGVIRHDRRGSGDFGANRSSGETSYPHEGIDIAVPPGTLVRAPATRKIRVADPYRRRPELAGKLDAVLIETPDGRLLTIMYVKPTEGIVDGAWVRAR